MCFRKAAGVVPLLQGFTKVQIGTRSGTAVPEWASSHSRFAAKMDFDTSHLALNVDPARESTERDQD
jgi:hypothetical protein